MLRLVKSKGFFILGLVVVCGLAGACDSGAEGQADCDLASCEKVPEAKCSGETAISYEATSVCDAAGQCRFNETRLNCAASDRTCVAGACLTAEEALCAEVVCETPPEDTCAGNNAVTYNETGTCNENGFCSYDFTETPCGTDQICSAGVCVTDDGSDPCLGVVCDDPPSDTCNGNNATVIYSQTGTCVDGLCNYDSTETSCEEGTSCSNGVCLDDADPCAGVNCTDPPENTCSGNTAITYADVGVCQNSICSYPPTENACVALTTCIEGICVPDADPCEGVECNTPPPNTCNGNSVVSYADTGICQDGICDYEETSTPCSGEQTCSNGVCVDNADPCAEIDCSTPPADTCNDNTAVVYPSVGVCTEGECSYTPTQTPCGADEICSAGLCLATDPCETMTCDSPPADFCDGNTATTHDPAGFCENGACVYTTSNEDCGTAAFCENGVCVSITETKVVINEIYYNPPTSQGDDLDYEFLELYNAGQTINLENWTFTSGIVHTFDAFTFENGTFLVLVNRPESYDTLAAPVIEWLGSNLKNDEETLTLADGSGIIMDTVTYDVRAAAGWPTAANGGGKSLELGHPSNDNAIPSNWHASDAMHGSPGAANSPVP